MGATSPLYYRWKNMMRRCYEVTHDAYPSYGGKGIEVCEEWHSWPAFRRQMGPSFADPTLTLDRIDNQGDYCPANCRWLSFDENRRKQKKYNLTTVRELVEQGLTQREIAELLGTDQPYISRLLLKAKDGPTL